MCNENVVGLVRTEASDNKEKIIRLISNIFMIKPKIGNITLELAADSSSWAHYQQHLSAANFAA